MSVSVRIPTILRTYTGGESNVELPADVATLQGALDALEAAAPGILQRLEGQNYKASQLNLLTAQPSPDTCEVVVLAGPRAELLPEERDRLARYVAAGGGLMVMLDPLLKGPAQPLLTQFLADWGIRAGNDVVLDASGIRTLVADSACGWAAVRVAR